MKNYIFLFLLFAFSTTVHSQKYRFETSGISMSVIDKNGKWTEFTKFKDAKIVVTLDTQKNRISVYSEIIQFFKIINYKETIVNDGNEIASFECANQDGEACLLSIYTYKNQSIKNRLYINYRDRIFAYNMKYVEK